MKSSNSCGRSGRFEACGISRSVAIVAARAASIAGRQAAPVEREAVTLAAGLRPRLRACRYRSGCNRDAAPEPTRRRSRAFWIAVERPSPWRRAGDQWRRSRSSASFLLRRDRIAHFRFRRHSGRWLGWLLARPVANDPDPSQNAVRHALMDVANVGSGRCDTSY